MTITNHGETIPNNKLEHIFDKYFRADENYQVNEKGPVLAWQSQRNSTNAQWLNYSGKRERNYCFYNHTTHWGRIRKNKISIRNKETTICL